MANLGPFSYDLNTAPDGYRCSGCNLHGVKLWRPYSSSHVKLKCAACLGATSDLDDSDQVDGSVPAVPDEDGMTWWGYSSVPQAGVEWWHRLPCAVRVRSRRQAMTAAEARRVDADAAAAKAKRDAETSAYLDDLTASTVLAVEATDFEAMTLWLNWTQPRDERPTPAWSEISLGRWVDVGKLGGDPVCVTLSFARVNGAVVAFYAATSVVSDSRMVDAWVRANMPRARLTNAMNFAPPARKE